MNRFDFSPYRRSTVGFDRLFDLLEGQARLNGGDNYPPFNIERRGEDSYRITLAVAGFRPDDIDITAQQNLLVVQGRRREEASDGEMLHVGIANRGFERRFLELQVRRHEGGKAEADREPAEDEVEDIAASIGLREVRREPVGPAIGVLQKVDRRRDMVRIGTDFAIAPPFFAGLANAMGVGEILGAEAPDPGRG